MPYDDPNTGYKERIVPALQALENVSGPVVVVGHSVSSGYAALVGDYPLAGHPDVPTVLIYAADDEIFNPAWERFMARELLSVEPIEIPGGHFPMVEDPESLADLLDRLAQDKLSSS